MIFYLVVPAVGFVLGLAVKRWSVVVAAASLLIVLSAMGLPLGWFNTKDMEPLGGLIITAIFLELPFLFSLFLGVWLRRSQPLRRQSNDITRLQRLG